MPSEFPGSPRRLKGALAVYKTDTRGTQPQIIVFQYNPNQVRRTLANRAAPKESSNVGSAREEVRRVLGPPVETITISVELDAADQLAEPSQHQAVVENGLYPALATLEMVLYPPSIRAQEIERLAAQGEVQLSPVDVPLLLLILGQSRVAPVMLTNFSITEEAFDQNLNPIQAKVDLGMRVLTYMELDRNTLGFDAYLAYQRQKETLASQHQSDTNATDRARGLLTF
jgi:hypothetical protein